MNKINNHDQIEEVFRVLKDPQKLWSDFYNKYKDNPQVLDLYEELRRYKEVGQKLEGVAEPNPCLQWQKLNYKITDQRRRRYSWMLAASVAVLLACTFVMQFEKIFNPQKVMVAKLQTIEKGNSKAVLITSAGEEYRLEAGADRIINEQDGVQICTDSNNVVKYAGVLDGKRKASEQPRFNTLKVPRLGEYQLVLSDGTKVWLNSQSELRYPVNFTGKQRVVELIGEAYFDVTPNPQKPFLVKTCQVDTRVLGTKFNVCTYPNEDMNITLVEGKVQLHSPQSSRDLILQPGENANKKVGASKIVVSKVDVRKYTAWRDGCFYFKKERLEDILTKLSRWYDFKVFYQNPVVKDYEFRMRADRKHDFKEIVRRLEQTGRISVQVKGNVVIISDAIR